MEVLEIVEIVLLVVGCIAFAVAMGLYLRTQRLLQEGVVTPGKVIRIDSYQDDGTTMYTPVYEYQDQSGNLQTFKSKVATSWKSRKIGDKAEIIYDPVNASNVKVKSFFGLYSTPLVLVAVGSIMLITAVILHYSG
ncbi:MAG: DUF3592 domain-containing protein [Bacteroidota bacterium]